MSLTLIVYYESTRNRSQGSSFILASSPRCLALQTFSVIFTTFNFCRKISWEGKDYYRYRICPKNWTLHDITSYSEARPPCSLDLGDITQGENDVKGRLFEWARGLEKVDKETGTLKMPLGSLELRLNEALGRI